MSKKGENIFKRKDGRWEARYVKGYEVSGKIRYGFCYGKTYREAKEKALIAKIAVMNNAPLMGKKRNWKFEFFCNEWLEMQRCEVKESTFVKYELCLRRHILPGLGEYYPYAVTTDTVEVFKQKLLLEEKLSPKMVKDILMVLHAVLKYASRKHPGVFAAVEIQYPREEKKEARILTLEEQRRFVNYLQTDMDNCKFSILLALLSGIRIGELCALRWENISLEERTIRIDSTMQRLKDTSGEDKGRTRVVIGNPKSQTSSRVIPMSESIMELCMKMKPDNTKVYLLTGTDHYMEPRTLQYRMRRYTKECGMEGVHFHTLRHTFATRCVEAGFELKSLSEILGHSNTSVTLNRYIHSSMDFKRDNMNKLSDLGL